MQGTWRAAAAVAAMAAFACAAAAQDQGDRSVDGRLLEILKKRGIISDSEFGELKTLEADLRKESDLEKNVDESVDRMVSRMVQDAPKTSYKPGQGFTFKTADDNFSLRVMARAQVRFTYDFRESTTANPNGIDSTTFAVQRLRLTFAGNAFDPKLKYLVEFDVAGDTISTSGASTVVNPAAPPPTFTGTSTGASANRFTNLRTGMIEYDWDPALSFMAGQFKVPYARGSELLSTANLEFVDRSIVDQTNTFIHVHEPGFMVFGKAFGESKDMLEYFLGIFNGDGTNTANIGPTSSTNGSISTIEDGYMYVGRVVVSPWGAVPYSEADLRPEGERKEFKLSLGANALYNEELTGTLAAPTHDDVWSAGLDLAMTWQGLYSHTELHYRQDEKAVKDRVVGWFTQLGYAIIPETFDVGLRYSTVDWRYSGTPSASANVALREYLFVLGYYWHQHAMKAQLDFGKFEDHRFDPTNSSQNDEWRLRLQMQVIF